MTAGNFYINDKSTGSVVGQQPFGGARMSGECSALQIKTQVSADLRLNVQGLNVQGNVKLLCLSRVGFPYSSSFTLFLHRRHKRQGRRSAVRAEMGQPAIDQGVFRPSYRYLLPVHEQIEREGHIPRYFVFTHDVIVSSRLSVGLT